MKKSFRPTRTNRPVSRPSAPRAPRPSSSSGRVKESFHQTPAASGSTHQDAGFQSKEIGGGGKEFQGAAPGGFRQAPAYLPPRRRWGGRRSVPIISGLVLIICCLIVLCLAVVYMVSQGIITLPSF